MSRIAQASKRNRGLHKAKRVQKERLRSMRVDVTPTMEKSNRGVFINVGEVVLVNLKGVGSTQKGVRPCVIINRNQGNNLITVVPLTTKGVKYRNQIMLIDRCLRIPSVALCDNQQTIDKIQILQKWGRLEKENFERIKNQIYKMWLDNLDRCNY